MLHLFFKEKKKLDIARIALQNRTCFFHLKENIKTSKGGTFSSGQVLV